MIREHSAAQPPGWLHLLGPGILVAATGVGAGDLATASFTGSHLGTSVLWAVVIGAFLKYVLNEGLARWQLVTGLTFLEGIAKRLGRVIGWLFLPYLVVWSFFVASALMSACGVTLQAMLPLPVDPDTGKIIYGISASLIGLVLVRWGGFRLFERMMSVCIAVMFVTVMVTAFMLWPGTGPVLRGLVLPTIPSVAGTAGDQVSGITWTAALLGGVGGTLTMLCYGYWIREEGRRDPSELRVCRIDLGTGYTMTALFGIGMVIIGSTIPVEGSGAKLITQLANRLGEPLGELGRWAFLLGALGAVFSSLLGVWQAIPYLFADIWRIFMHSPTPLRDVRRPLRETRAYRWYLLGLGTIPIFGLFLQFREVQKLYGVIGASIIPLLALGLLLLNRRKVDMGSHAYGWASCLVLLASLGLFVGMAILRFR